MDAKQTAIKINYKGDVHSLHVDLTSFLLKALKALFPET
uniref:Uncharacterized protein n=1 Tax=Peronospora matthiolae TaxID=2874970 RepID=A0AAV1TSK0_9STRA